MGVKHIVIIVVFILVILILLALVWIRTPTVEVEHIAVDECSPLQAYIILRLELKIENPNLVGGIVEAIEGRVYIENQYIGPVYTEQMFAIRGASISFGTVYLKVEHVPTEIFGKKEVTVKVDGVAIVRILGQVHYSEFDEQNKVYLTSQSETVE